MHAYASEDPVFRALNALGQAETNGELGDFCVQCHAPLAVELGLTTDGLELDEVPEHLRGIGCTFCHQVDAVEAWISDNVSSLEPPFQWTKALEILLFYQGGMGTTLRSIFKPPNPFP